MEKQSQSEVKAIVFKPRKSSDERMRNRIYNSSILDAKKSKYSHIEDLAVNVYRTVEDYHERFLKDESNPEILELLALALATRLHANVVRDNNTCPRSGDELQIMAATAPILFGGMENLDADHLYDRIAAASEIDSFGHLEEIFPIPPTESDDSLGDDDHEATFDCEDFAELILGLVNAKAHAKHETKLDLEKSMSISITAIIVVLRRLLIAVKQEYGTKLSFLLEDWIENEKPMPYTGMLNLMKAIHRELFGNGESNEFIDNLYSETV